MRMRVKKWARPELAECPYYIGEPARMRGKWAQAFLREQPIYLELGCGKGVSTCQLALNEPRVNLIAVDLITTVLGVLKRNADNAFAGVRNVDNLLITNFDIEHIGDYIAPPDEIERVYISFCNPWTQRHRQQKHRLTHTRQLEQYKQFLAKGAQIHFKTDDGMLFRDSRAYFEQAGFEIIYLTEDLDKSGYSPNYESEHEQRFRAQGVPIKFLIAQI